MYHPFQCILASVPTHPISLFFLACMYDTSLVLLLTDDDEILVNISSQGLTLSCTLAGYVDNASSEPLVNWTFNAEPLASGHKHSISVTNEEVTPYGKCSISYLNITDLSKNDLGEYMCSHGSLSQTITLIGQ